MISCVLLSKPICDCHIFCNFLHPFELYYTFQASMDKSSSAEDQKQNSWKTTTATGVPVNSYNSKTESHNYEQQPHQLPSELKPKIRNPWSTGLCDCFSDFRNCKFPSFLSSSILFVLFCSLICILLRFRLHHVLVSLHYFRTSC